MKNWLKRIFLCRILGHHEWTSAVRKGEKPTDEQINKGVDGFWEFARMWCDRCGKPSKLNKV